MRRWWQGVAIVAPALLACAPRGSTRMTPLSSPASLAPRVSPGALDVAPLFRDLPGRASRAGAGPLAVVASGPMSEGERLGAFVDVPKGACLLLYGRAADSLEDLDLAAFAEDGSVLIVDESSDRAPTLLLCPPAPSRVYVAARAASGSGLCAVGAQLVAENRSSDVARASGARGRAGGPPLPPEAWPGLDEQVRAHRAATGGTWTELRRVAVAVDARSVSAVSFNVEEGGCSDVLVVPDDDVAVVDVDAIDAEGRLIARAKDSGPTRSMTVCSQVAVAGSLQVRPHTGRGAVAIVIANAKPAAERELFARPSVAWIAPSQPLTATRAARNAALSKAGYAAPSSVQNGQLLLGSRATVPVELARGSNTCSRIDVVGGAPLAHLDVSAWTDGGTLLGSAEGIGDAALFVCGQGKVRLDIGTRGRPGPYAVLVRPERWKEAAFVANPLAAGRMLGRAAVGPLWTHDGTAGAVRHAVLDSVHKYMHSARIEPNTCLRVAMGIEGEGTGLDARLFDTVTGEELDRAHGQTTAALVACAAQSARMVRLEAAASAGRVDAVVGERTSPSPP